jgi:hypothetical protein
MRDLRGRATNIICSCGGRQLERASPPPADVNLFTARGFQPHRFSAIRLLSVLLPQRFDSYPARQVLSGADATSALRTRRSTTRFTTQSLQLRRIAPQPFAITSASPGLAAAERAHHSCLSLSQPTDCSSARQAPTRFALADCKSEVTKSQLHGPPEPLVRSRTGAAFRRPRR